MISQQLLGHHPIISDQISRPALAVVLRELEIALGQGVAGDIAEFGCYIGTTSLFIRSLLDATGQSARRHFYAYDSFEGLPSKAKQDASAAGNGFKAGELKVSKRQFLQEFKKAKLVPPITRKAWFDDLTANDLPGQIAYAFLDGDFYGSILASLRLVWPRLSPGGVITVDDFQRESLPGVERAVHGFFGGDSKPVRHQQNIAIIRK